MIKEILKKQQPIVYQAIEKACENQRISSAYLFTGPYGTPKFETAVFLAQSILCEKQEGLACETCNTCRRVKENLYEDLVILDGRKESITKEMIDGIQEKFSKTALEANGQRVYIIRNAENASISAQNSMLKFLEEPGKGVTAILTTDSINRLLPTIISRCTMLPFVPNDEDAYCSELEASGVPEEDSYFLSRIVKDRNDLSDYMDLESGTRTPEYEHAIGMLKQYLNIGGMKREELSVDYEINWASQSTDRAKNRKENSLLLHTFFDLLILYCQDVLKEHADLSPDWYKKAVEQKKNQKEECITLLQIASEEKDLCNRYNDYNLIMYQTFFRLEEEI